MQELLWQLEGVLDDLVVVDVEEVRVDEGLDQSCGDADEVQTLLGEVSVDPVRQVERSVEPQCEDVVDCEEVALALALEHEELWQDGHRFQPEGETPRDLQDGELVVEDQRHHCRGHHQVRDPEIVDVLRDFLCVFFDDVDRVERRAEEEQLHQRVVHGPEVERHETEVPRDEHNRIEDLCLQRDSACRLLRLH